MSGHLAAVLRSSASVKSMLSKQHAKRVGRLSNGVAAGASLAACAPPLPSDGDAAKAQKQFKCMYAYTAVQQSAAQKALLAGGAMTTGSAAWTASAPSDVPVWMFGPPTNVGKFGRDFTVVRWSKGK
jgi:hypothetical protein